MKLCKDCKHYDSTAAFDCRYASKDVITGEQTLNDASMNRLNDLGCGPYARYFIPKEPELLPCPFCGGEACIRTGDYFQVSCMSCLGKVDQRFVNQREAVAAWNRRSK